MRVFGYAVLAILLLGAKAGAADMPVYKAPPRAPQVMYSWTGFYLGAHVGYGWGRKVWSNPGLLLSDHTVSGGFAGVQGGFNYQIQNIVIGIEADGSWGRVRGEGLDPFLDVLRSRVDWMSTLSGRLGLAVDRVLLYGKVGGAWVGDNFSFVAPLGRNAALTDNRSGWAAGVGIEFAAWDGWSVKLEYDHLRLGTKHITFVTGDFADVEQRLNLVKLGLNYRFGGPVVARY